MSRRAAAPTVLEGRGVSPGVAIGRAVCIETRGGEVYRFPLAEAAVEGEVARLGEAVERARQELKATEARARRELGDQLVAIFGAQALLLEDRALLGRTEARIRDERVNAEWAVHKTAEELAERFEQLEHARFRERGDDLRDVTRLLLRSLQGVAHHELEELEGDVVIVAHDLTPSEAVRLGRQRVAGFALETGGPTSHTAIIARDLCIPLVTGLAGVTRLVTDDDPVIVDGERGRVVLHPAAADLDRYRRRRRRRAAREARLLETRSEPCVSRDRVAVQLMANIDLPEEIDEAVRYGATGIGLYRSEFLYIESSPGLPTEEDHLRTYRRLLDAVHPHPVVIRTFDLGGRKLAREVMETEEDNPVLGLRGIRLTLGRPEVFESQLRALLRAGVGRNLGVMLPMVSTLEEVRQFRELAGRVRAQLAAEGIEHTPRLRLGVMIEVPSAALIADHLAAEVDFFSLGTNDLIQYSMAVDRNNEHVGYLYRPLHPAILRMIRFVVDSAQQAGIEVSMCGEMAADPRYTALLLGLGLRQLSVSSRAIPEIKSRIRELSVAELGPVTERCLKLASAADVEAELDSYLGTGVATAEGAGTVR